VTSQRIAERLEAFIRTQFAIAPSDTRFSRSVLLFEHGYIDSVGAVELLAFVQSEFGVAVPDDELLSDEFSTIEGIATIIGRVRGDPVEAKTESVMRFAGAASPQADRLGHSPGQ
jgi:acyl carrier protein